MEPIRVRYGEGKAFPFDAADVTAISADLYVGRPGEAYKFTKHIELELGLGIFELSDNDTRIPLGTYNYQINVNYPTGGPDKYPSPEDDCDDCEPEFPEFVVHEALDEQEVS